MKRSMALLVLSLVFLSCAPKYETIVMKEYQGRRIDNASLVIALPIDMLVDYMGNVKDEFGEGDQNNLIIKHFKEKLLEQLKKQSSFSSAAFDSFSVRPAMQSRSFTTSDPYGLSVNLPSDTATIIFKSSNPDFILFIQDLRIGQESVQENSWGRAETGKWPVAGRENGRISTQAFSSYQGPGAAISGFQPPVFTPTYNPPMYFYSPPKTKYLRYKCNFAFWDNRVHNVVAYGKIFAKSKPDEYGMGMVSIVRMSNWVEIDYQFTRALLGQTPFDKY
jgi:hypothetical protein